MAEWKCPECDAPAHKHGRGGKTKCVSDDDLLNCEGLVCECDVDDDIDGDHGLSQNDPCENAVCYHCGWGGRLPPKPKKMAPWEKKALEAGWKPPAGWGGV